MAFSPTTSNSSSVLQMAALFASSTSTVAAVLARDDIAEYLQQQRTTSKCLLSFIERNMEELVEIARYADLAAAVNGDLSSSPLKNDTETTKGGVTASSSHSKKRFEVSSSISCKDDDDGATGKRNDTSATASVSLSTSASPIAVPSLAAVTSTEASLLPSTKGEAADLSSIQFRINATELLTVYITATGATEIIQNAVAASMHALACPQASRPDIALVLQRLLLAAFDVDFACTTEAIASALSEEIVHNIIDNIARSSIVGETMIALFGSALPIAQMMLPTTRTHLFTEAWIRYRFPEQLCALLPFAIATPSYYNYFYFIKELLKRGFSHTAGPIVDILLEYRLWSSFADTILEHCEREAQRVGASSPRSPGSQCALAPNLCADAMGVITAVVSLVRKSLVVPEARDMYFSDISQIAPLLVLCRHATRIVALLDVHRDEDESGSDAREEDGVSPASSGVLSARSGGVAAGTLGMMRFSVCELFVELVHYRLAATDDIVIRTGFLRSFLSLCHCFPNHDILIRLLDKCLALIFSRSLLQGETPLQSIQRDWLVSHVVAPPGSGLAEQHKGFRKLLGVLCDFASDPQLRHSTLSAHCIDTLKDLSTLPLFTGPLSTLMEPYAASEPAQLRLKAMQDSITGDSFTVHGSGCSKTVVHRPLINLAGERFCGSLGVSTNGRASSCSLDLCDGEEGTDEVSSANNWGNEKSPPLPGSIVSIALPSPALVIDMDTIGSEVKMLREAGSPQLQAYPSFRSMHLAFGGEQAAESGDREVQKVTEHVHAPTGATASVVVAASTSPAHGDGSSEDSAASVMVAAPLEEDNEGDDKKGIAAELPLFLSGSSDGPSESNGDCNTDEVEAARIMITRINGRAPTVIVKQRPAGLASSGHSSAVHHEDPNANCHCDDDNNQNIDVSTT